MVDALLDVRADFHVLAAADSAKFLNSRNFLPEAHTARAVDAAGHVRGDERPEVLVGHDTLFLRVARYAAAETEREILELAFAALVADRAIERVVDQQELHRGLLRRDRARRARGDLHAVGDRCRAGGQRFRRALDVHETHAAVRCDRKLAVIAESRHIDADAIGDIDQHLPGARLDRLAVDFDADCLFVHARVRPGIAGSGSGPASGAATMLLPPWSIMYSNS